MSKDVVTNYGKSVRDKLLNIAKNEWAFGLVAEAAFASIAESH